MEIQQINQNTDKFGTLVQRVNMLISVVNQISIGDPLIVENLQVEQNSSVSGISTTNELVVQTVQTIQGMLQGEDATFNGFVNQDLGDFNRLEIVTDAEINGDLDLGGNLTVSGNLTVEGTTTTVNTEDLEIKDNKILVNAGETAAGISHPSGRAGIEVDRGQLQNQKFFFRESDDLWVFDNGTEIKTPVYQTGDQILSGIKTFSSSPVVPTPTEQTQAQNKEYVDSAVQDYADSSSSSDIFTLNDLALLSSAPIVKEISSTKILVQGIISTGLSSTGIVIYTGAPDALQLQTIDDNSTQTLSEQIIDVAVFNGKIIIFTGSGRIFVSTDGGLNFLKYTIAGMTTVRQVIKYENQLIVFRNTTPFSTFDGISYSQTAFPTYMNFGSGVVQQINYDDYILCLTRTQDIYKVFRESSGAWKKVILHRSTYTHNTGSVLIDGTRSYLYNDSGKLYQVFKDASDTHKILSSLDGGVTWLVESEISSQSSVSNIINYNGTLYCGSRVRTRGGDWVDIESIDGTFICGQTQIDGTLYRLADKTVLVGSEFVRTATLFELRESLIDSNKGTSYKLQNQNISIEEFGQSYTFLQSGFAGPNSQFTDIQKFDSLKNWVQLAYGEESPGINRSQILTSEGDGQSQRDIVYKNLDSYDYIATSVQYGEENFVVVGSQGRMERLGSASVLGVPIHTRADGKDYDEVKYQAGVWMSIQRDGGYTRTTKDSGVTFTSTDGAITGFGVGINQNGLVYYGGEWFAYGNNGIISYFDESALQWVSGVGTVTFPFAVSNISRIVEHNGSIYQLAVSAGSHYLIRSDTGVLGNYVTHAAIDSSLGFPLDRFIGIVEDYLVVPMSGGTLCRISTNIPQQVSVIDIGTSGKFAAYDGVMFTMESEAIKASAYNVNDSYKVPELVQSQNFNGRPEGNDGTATARPLPIRTSSNIWKIERTAAGVYQVTFKNKMKDENYIVTGNAVNLQATGEGGTVDGFFQYDYQFDGFKIRTLGVASQLDNCELITFLVYK